MSIVYPDKIQRLLSVSGIDSISDIFWPRSLKKINKDLRFLAKNNYTFGIEPLSSEYLDQFYTLYKDEIWSKPHAVVFDLLERLSPRLNDKTLYFAFIKDASWMLLWWSILSYRNDRFTLAYKASIRSTIKIQTSLWVILDYLFFDFWLSSSFDFTYFSLGKDRNWYGCIWANITLALHKLRYGFFPYISNTADMATIDGSNIDTYSLFFVWPENERKLTQAILYHSIDESVVDMVSFLENLWFVVNTFTF